MKGSVFVAVITSIITLSAVADDSQLGNDSKVFDCKLKTNSGEKAFIKFRSRHLNSAQEILSLQKYHSLVMNNVSYFLMGAMANDDECTVDTLGNDGRCRMVVYMRKEGGSASVGYANNSSKTGTLNLDGKFSCIVRVPQIGEIGILE